MSVQGSEKKILHLPSTLCIVHSIVTHTAELDYNCGDQHAPVSSVIVFSAANREHADMIVKHLIKKEVRKKALFMTLLVHVPFVYIGE